MSIVRVEDLRVVVTATDAPICDWLSFEIDEGEIVGLVGESGSGKSTAAMALLGYARRGAHIASGHVYIDGTDILALDEKTLTSLRGKQVSFVPQDPATALNPARRVRAQMLETLAAHGIGADKRERIERVQEAFASVKLPYGDDFISRYPHQLSGGQQQRVCIAMATICKPAVVVFDEPTTGLDVTTQAHFLKTVEELASSTGLAALYVTHDLAVIANLARRVLVMYGGILVESGPRSVIFEAAAHPYTRKLLGAMPDIAYRRTLQSVPGRAPAPGLRPPGCVFTDRCEFAIPDCSLAQPPLIDVGPSHTAACIRTAELDRRSASSPFAELRSRSVSAQPLLGVEHLSAFYGQLKAVDDASLDLSEDECLAIVGESGSGKSTLARSIIGLLPEHEGVVSFKGSPLAKSARDRPSEIRRELQYIFQNPYGSLNPRHRVEDIVATPLRFLLGQRRREARAHVLEALDRVALTADVSAKYPDQLSGGERQRVAIARALVCKPSVLVCDEITSALDVSVQATIIELLSGLRAEEKLGLLFITHNLALVRSIADRTIIMRAGRVVEHDTTDELLDNPKDAYTRRLLSDTPRPLVGVVDQERPA